ncbi:MAG: hypothetical protein E6J22_12410 [Chloroflexi bacterium]|nr:MAG: hypothetical protein E6J22_12410 [Chloroflexota bacterium]
MIRPPGCQMSKHFSAAFTQQVTRFSSQASAHIGIFSVDRQPPIRPDRPRKGLLIDLHEPAGSHDRLWNALERRLGRTGHTRRLVATGACLVGPLAVGVGEIRESSLRDLRERPWPMHEAPTPEALER